MKKLFLSLMVLLVVAGSSAWYVHAQYQQFLDTPLNIPNADVTLLVEPGMTGKSVISSLASRGISEDGWQWRILFRLHPVVLKAGEYALPSGLRPEQLLTLLEEGDVIRYRFTLIEGWTYKQVITALYADPVIGPWLTENLSKDQLLEAHSIFGSPEGALLPETYLYTRDDTPLDILDRAADAMIATLAEAWELRAEDHPVSSPYELLVLASIIEKETSLDEEREIVSGVFVRRLNKGMRLQTDPTVIYGLGDRYDGDIRRRDLTTDTPYNTYTRHGLPPTPIAMPGRASLLAAARPADGDALYFVADGKGGHTFSATLEEHQRGVRKLIGKD